MERMGQVHEVEMDGQEFGLVYGKPDAPAIMLLEADTVDLMVRFQDLRRLQQQALSNSTRLSLVIEQLRVLRERVKSGEDVDAEMEALLDKQDALSEKQHSLQTEMLRLGRYDPAMLDPYYTYAVTWTRDVIGLDWEAMTEQERIDWFCGFKVHALLDYVDVINGSVALGQAKKKPSTPTSTPSSTRRANVTSVSKRRTRKKRKKKGRDTTASSPTSTKK